MKNLFILLMVFFGSTAMAQSFKAIPANEFSEKLKEEGVILIDVRTEGEFTSGHLEGARNIDFLEDSFPDIVGEFDKEKVYLIYCKAGGRSEDARKEMESLGFKTVYDLQGGIGAWTGKLVK